MNAKPTEPGFYWALWLTAAHGTHEGDQLTLPQSMEVVEVFRNQLYPAQVDDEEFGVAVTGVRETQWLHNFRWGPKVEFRV